MKNYPFVSIITVNYNGKKFLKQLFTSLKKTNYPESKQEIIVVDNGSSDGSVGYVKRYYPYVKIIQNDINNYCNAVNRGINDSKGQYIAIINNDVKVDRNWLIELVKVIKEDSEIGAVGSKVLFMNGKLQSVGHQEYPNYYWVDRGFSEEDKGQYDYIQEVPSMPNVCGLYRKKCFEDVGLFDEDFNMYLEDIDMGIRCKTKGWKLLVVPTSKVYHHLHGTIGTEENARFLQEKNRLILLAKHYPEEFPSALSGSGFLIKKGSKKEKEFTLMVAEAYKKLFVEHDIETVVKITPQLFDNLRKVFYFEKDTLLHKIIDLEEEVDKLKKHFHEKDKYVKNLEVKEKELDSERNKLVQKISKIEGEKNNYLKMNEEKGRIIDNLKEIFAKLEKDKNTTIEKLDGVINSLESKIKSKNQQIEEYKIRLDKLDVMNEKLTKEVKNKDSKINLLGEELEYRKRNLKKATEGYASKCNELNSIYNSTGFKFLLRPLWVIIGFPKRMIIKTLAGTKNILKNIMYYSFHPFNSRVLSKGKYFFYLIKNYCANIRKKNEWSRYYLNHIFRDTIPPPPRYLTLMLTAKCNVICDFCSIPQRNYSKKMISKQEAFDIIDSAVRLGIEEIEFTGGEPLLHPDLWKISNYAQDRSLKIHLVTNGILIQENIEKIKELNFASINISIDGKRKTHEKLRNAPDIYNKVMNGIKILKELDKYIVINSIITNKNIHELDEMVKDFDTMGIKTQFWPVNNQKNLYLNKRVERKKYKTFIKKAKNENIISSEWYDYLKKGLAYFKGKKYSVRCLGLALELAVDTEGFILPCCVWNRNNERFRLGNVFKHDLDTIWYSEKARKIRKEIFSQGCKNCYNSGIVNFKKVTGLDFRV